MKKLLLILLLLFIFFSLKNPAFARITCSSGIGEGEAGCSTPDKSGNPQGDCCPGLKCQGSLSDMANPTQASIANGSCINQNGGTTIIPPTPKPVVNCKESDKDKLCDNNDECCSKICALVPAAQGSVGVTQKKCFSVKPTWPPGCQAPNEACENDSNCCYGTCIKQGGGHVCMEGAPSSNNPPPCSEWQDGKCIKIASGLGIDIPTDVPGIIKTFFGIILSVAGATATLLFIYAGYKIMAARGNPEKFQEAKDRFTSTILGLLFIILSLVILQVIGVDLLQIPGFE